MIGRRTVKELKDLVAWPGGENKQIECRGLRGFVGRNGGGLLRDNRR